MSYKIVFVARTAVLLCITILLQMIGLPLQIVGPLINTMIFLGYILMGYVSAGMISLLSPWIALHQGIIPADIEPAIPNIILGNLALVLTFGYLYQKNLAYKIQIIPAIIIGSLLKYYVILLPIKYFHQLTHYQDHLVHNSIFYHAFIGGILAIVIYRILKYLGIKEFDLLNLRGTPM